MAEEAVVEVPEWASSIEDEGLKSAVSGFDSVAGLFDAVGYVPPEPEEVDWRSGITDEDGVKFAESSTDINHLVRRAMDLRKQVSGAIIKPSKEATDDQIAAYRKAMGIPESTDGYEFPDVDEMTDALEASRQAWAGRFHSLGIPRETASALIQAVNEDAASQAASEVEADKAFASRQKDALRAEWKDDFDKNTTIANRAFADIATRSGLTLEDLTSIETKDGRFLFDRAEMVKLFATIGREMQEGSLGPVLSESERETGEDQIRDLREQISQAQNDGQSERANVLYEKLLGLRAKVDGDQSLIGASGRVS